MLYFANACIFFLLYRVYQNNQPPVLLKTVFLNRLKLADLHFETGQYEKSGSNYRFIISENPRFVAAYINYGFLELSINKEDKKAEQLYKVALDTDPDNEQALLNMAGLMVYRNQKVQGKEYISRVLKINPENAQALRLLKLL